MAELSRTYVTESGDERRIAQRMLLVYRTVKLIFGEHEILAVIRNVSSTGIAFRTFNAIDLPEQLHVKLANGSIVPIKLAWQDKLSYGASFQTSVDLDIFLKSPPPDDRSGRSLRAKVGLKMYLRHNGRRWPAMLHDIGIGGAKLELERGQNISVNGYAEMTIEGLGAHEGEIKWKRGPCAGMQFSHSLSFSSLAKWTTQLVNARMLAGSAPDSVDWAAPQK